MSVGISFLFQYGLAPALIPDTGDGGVGTLTSLPGIGQYLVDSWNDGCNDLATEELQSNCRENSGVYRVSTVSTLFFLFAAVSAYFKPSSNREAWPFKIGLYLLAVVGSIFIPNSPLFSDIYMQIGRVLGACFIVIQQLILLDISYNLNDAWVRKADDAYAIEPGTGKKWLAGLLVSCGILYIGSIVVITFLFTLYAGCSSNETFISITLLLSILVTAVQMSGEEASLLTSAVLTAYGTYLCLLTVSKNPNGECNPNIRERNVLGIVLGIAMTLLSLTWAGWSNTANKRLLSDSLVNKEHGEGSSNSYNSREVKGIVLSDDGNYGSTDKRNKGNNEDEGELNDSDSIASTATWKMNCILMLLVSWISMVLTGWGSNQAGGDIANPGVHTVSMWMIAASQWTMFALYLWSLVAPKLFPDREFS